MEASGVEGVRMDENVIVNMRARAAMCRRLAKSVLDQHAIKALRKMADDIEADVRQLEAKRGPRIDGA